MPSIGAIPSGNSAELEVMRQDIESLKQIIANLNSGEEQFDLKKEQFEHMFTKCKLKLDYISKAATGEMLNQVFKKQLKKEKGGPAGYTDYKFSPRVIDQVLSLKQ